MVFHSAARAIAHERKYPNAMPSTPPPTEMSTDSVRNWRTMSFRLEPDVDTVQLVLKETVIRKPVLKRVERNVNEVVQVLDLRAGFRTGTGQLAQQAHDFEPRVVDFHELAQRGAVAQQIHLRLLAQHAHRCGRLVVQSIQKTPLRYLQVVNLR